MTHLEYLPNSHVITVPMDEYVDYLLTTTRPCAVCGWESIMEVEKSDYCILHSGEAYNDCVSNDPNTSAHCYTLIATPMSVKWVYTGNRITRCERCDHLVPVGEDCKECTTKHEEVIRTRGRESKKKAAAIILNSTKKSKRRTIY